MDFNGQLWDFTMQLCSKTYAWGFQYV